MDVEQARTSWTTTCGAATAAIGCAIWPPARIAPIGIPEFVRNQIPLARLAKRVSDVEWARKIVIFPYHNNQRSDRHQPRMILAKSKVLVWGVLHFSAEVTHCRRSCVLCFYPLLSWQLGSRVYNWGPSFTIEVRDSITFEAQNSTLHA